MFSSSSNNVRNVGDVSLSLFCFFAPLYHVYKQTRQQTMRLNSLTIAFVVRANRINTDYLIIEFRYNPTDGFLMWERVFADLIIHNLQNIDYCQRMRWLIEARKLFQTLASYVQPTYHPSSNLRNCISVSKLNQLNHHIDLLRRRTVWLVANYRLICLIFHLERLCVTFANTPVVYRLLYLFIFLVSDLYSRNEEVTSVRCGRADNNKRPSCRKNNTILSPHTVRSLPRVVWRWTLSMCLIRLQVLIQGWTETVCVLFLGVGNTWEQLEYVWSSHYIYSVLEVYCWRLDAWNRGVTPVMSICYVQCGCPIHVMRGSRMAGFHVQDFLTYITTFIRHII